MPHYLLAFEHSVDTGEEELQVGDAFRYQGDVWRVDKIDMYERKVTPYVFLSRWPNEVPYPPQIKGASA